MKDKYDYSFEETTNSDLFESELSTIERPLKESAALEKYPEATLLIEGVISMLRKKDISKSEIKKLFDDRLATFR